MKIILHSNSELDLLCITNNKSKKFTLKKHYTMNVANNLKEVKFIQQYQNEKTNIFGFIFFTLLFSFLETQKTYEKRNFVSFYDFAYENLISNFCFYINGKEVINIYAKEKKFNNFRYLYWTSDEINIINKPPYKALKKCLIELIGFWFIVLFIPITILAIITIIAYIKWGNIFDVGIALIVFILLVFICNITIFIVQYIKIKNNIKNFELIN